MRTGKLWGAKMESKQERGAKMVSRAVRGGALAEMERKQVNLESE